MADIETKHAPFTAEWMIAAAVFWVVSAACCLLMFVLKTTGIRYLDSSELVGAVGLMMAQHVMTMAICAVTCWRNRTNRSIAIASGVLLALAVLQSGFLMWLLIDG